MPGGPGGGGGPSPNINLYLVTVREVRTVQEDIPVTAESQEAAVEAAIAEWKSYVMDRNENVTFDSIVP